MTWKISSYPCSSGGCVEVAGPWRKSTRSSVSDCVEVSVVDHPVGEGSTRLRRVVRVRDSKDRTGPVLRFSPTAWREFIAAARRGDLDARSEDR